MFKSLQPLLAERSIHIMLSATKDGRMNVYVSPAKKDDKEDAAFTTPFQCTATAEELEAQLPDVLAKWIASRQVVTTDLATALEAAEAATKKAAEAAKAKAAEKGKKVLPTSSKAVVPAKAGAKPAAPVTPSLLDGCVGGAGQDEDDEDSEATGGESVAPAVEAAAPTPEAAPVAVAPEAVPVAVVAPPVAVAPAPVAAPVVAEAPAPVAPVVAPAAVLTTAPMTTELF